MGDRMKLQARPYGVLSRTNPISQRNSVDNQPGKIESRSSEREINTPQERALYAN